MRDPANHGFSHSPHSGLPKRRSIDNQSTDADVDARQIDIPAHVVLTGGVKLRSSLANSLRAAAITVACPIGPCSAAA